VIDILAIDLLGVIPEDEAILVSSNRGLPVALSSTNSTSASQAFRNIAQRLGGEEVPIMDFNEPSGLFNRLRSWVSGR
jgi:septum site-determining protein MinD